MKARKMADLLIGETRFDVKRKPSNLEVSALTVLAGEVASEIRLKLLESSTEEAARLKVSDSESVSVISSIIAATAVCFPKDVLVVTSPEKFRFPPFLGLLDTRRYSLDGPVASKDDALLAIVRQRWYWGVSVGILQILRWVEPVDLEAEGISHEGYWKSTYDLALYFLGLMFARKIEAMLDPLKNRLAEIVADLAKNHQPQFEVLVRQIAKRNRSPVFSDFGSQLWTELRNRYWFTRSSQQQDHMIVEG